MRFTMLLLSFLIVSISAIRPSSRSPVVFYVGPAPFTGFEAHASTSIRTDGNWTLGGVPETTLAHVRGIYPNADVVVVNTDDERGNRAGIRDWIERECFHVLLRDVEDCFVLSELSYTPFKSSMDVYSFRRWESSARHTVRHAIMHFLPQRTTRPSASHTSTPSVPTGCTQRMIHDCVSPCEYLGTRYGCRPFAWCGFGTHIACESQNGCEFRRDRCRARLTL